MTKKERAKPALLSRPAVKNASLSAGMEVSETEQTHEDASPDGDMMKKMGKMGKGGHAQTKR